MAIEYVRDVIASGYNLSKINDNFAKIEQALQDAVSRSGEGPNAMASDIDLNSNDLLNAGIVDTAELRIGGAVVTPDALATIPPSIMLKNIYDPTGIGLPIYEALNHTYKIDTVNAIIRNVQDKLRELPSIEDYYSNEDTYNSAFTKMATDLGYVRFTRGEHKLTTFTIAVPIYFEIGAYLTADLGNTITITTRITAPKQFILQGAGSYIINIAGPIGEDAKEVHVSWWGVFPTNTTDTDQSPSINKALSAFSAQTREGRMKFDFGSYHVHSTITVPRGIHILGNDTRRTVFDVSGSGYDVFVTAGEACKFSNFQFEQPSGEVVYRTGALIRLSHDNCEVFNIWGWNSEIVVAVDGDNCYVKQIRGTYAVTMPADTAVVTVNKGGANIEDVRILSTGGPESLVEVGRTAAANFGIISINNLQTNGPTRPVLIETGVVVSRINIGDAIFSGSGGVSCDSIVKVVTTGAGGLNGLAIDKAQGNSLCSTLLTIEHGGSGTVENIVIDDSVLQGSGATAFSFTRTAGTLRDITIGDAVEVRERTEVVTRSGTMTNIRVSPMVIGNTLPVGTISVSLASGAVHTIPLYRSLFSCAVEITAGISDHGIFTCRPASSPSVSANRLAVATTVATASGLTSGVVDSNITLGVQDAQLQVRNGLATTQTVTITIKAGP
jgi:hypothetical protein